MASTFSFQSRSRHQVGWVSFGYGCTLLIKDFKGYVINFPVRWINLATFAGTVSIKNIPMLPLGAPWQRSLFLLVRLYIQVSDGPSRYRLFVLIKSHTIKKKKILDGKHWSRYQNCSPGKLRRIFKLLYLTNCYNWGVSYISHWKWFQNVFNYRWMSEGISNFTRRVDLLYNYLS